MNTILNQNEIWRTVNGFPHYLVSNKGRIKRTARIVIPAKGPRRPYKLRPKIMHPTFCKSTGWVVGAVNFEGKHRHLIIARAMLSAFVRLPIRKEMARHLNDDKRNNKLENLAWGTTKDNSQDAIRNGRQPRGSKLGTSKLTETQVRYIKNSTLPSLTLAKRYGVTRSNIQAILSGKTWNHVAPCQ